MEKKFLIGCNFLEKEDTYGIYNKQVQAGMVIDYDSIHTNRQLENFCKVVEFVYFNILIPYLLVRLSYLLSPLSYNQSKNFSIGACARKY